MNSLSTPEAHELIKTSRRQYRALLKDMAPSRFVSWDWHSPDFKEGAKWLLEHPHEIRAGIYLSDTPNKEVWKLTVPQEHEEHEVVIKFYQEPDLSWFNLWKRSIAVKETLNYATLEGLGIPVAKPLACGEVRKFGKLQSSYIVTRFIDNVIDGSMLMPTGYLAENKKLKISFCKKTLEIIARAHICGFMHSEFHPHKILLTKDNSSDSFNLVLIDVAHGGFNKTLSMRAAIAIDLATFFIDLRLDAEDIENLCEHYLKFNTSCGFTPESLWEAIISVDFPTTH